LTPAQQIELFQASSWSANWPQSEYANFNSLSDASAISSAIYSLTPNGIFMSVPTSLTNTYPISGVYAPGGELYVPGGYPPGAFLNNYYKVNNGQTINCFYNGSLRLFYGSPTNWAVYSVATIPPPLICTPTNPVDGAGNALIIPTFPTYFTATATSTNFSFQLATNPWYAAESYSAPPQTGPVTYSFDNPIVADGHLLYNVSAAQVGAVSITDQAYTNAALYTTNAYKIATNALSISLANQSAETLDATRITSTSNTLASVAAGLTNDPAPLSVTTPAIIVGGKYTNLLGSRQWFLLNYIGTNNYSLTLTNLSATWGLSFTNFSGPATNRYEAQMPLSPNDIIQLIGTGITVLQTTQIGM
jgi:hypothetical protein